MSLEFFRELSGRLEIALSEPTHAITPKLMNQAAPPTAKIVSLRFEAEVFDDDEPRPLTEEELDRVVLVANNIRLRDAETRSTIEHLAPDGLKFTVRDMIDVVERSELAFRQKSDWFGGVDVHHVFFEGMEEVDGAWEIHWGS